MHRQGTIGACQSGHKAAFNWASHRTPTPRTSGPSDPTTSIFRLTFQSQHLKCLAVLPATAIRATSVPLPLGLVLVLFANRLQLTN